MNSLQKENLELKNLIKDSLPFLEEAWECCFDGKKEKMLSAEERGMGHIISQFKQLEKGKFPEPLGYMKTREAFDMINKAQERTLGDYGKLHDLCHDSTENAFPPNWGGSILDWAAGEIKALRK